jgi:hypothetical protein
MLFMLRLAFWIMLVVLLLPSSSDDNRRFMSSAERTVSDMRGFCQRNPEVCEDAHIAMTSILSKLRSGAELLQTWLLRNGKTEEERVGAAQTEIPRKPQASGNALPPRPVPKWQDSLSPADKQVPWRGPSGL